MSYPCKHWQDIGIRDGGACGLKVYPNPSYGTCARCPKYEGPVRGLGDVIHGGARVVDAVLGTNLRGCSGCQQRRVKLNELTK